MPGKFRSLKKIDSLLKNERVCTILKGDEIEIAIIQIASRLVRRIVPFIKEGENVEISQRIGMIRFGSQVDILLQNNENTKIMAKVKDIVKAGTSVIAEY